MQIVNFNDNFIDILDVEEDKNKIYCYTDGKEAVSFLSHPGNNHMDKTETYNYYWTNLTLRLKTSCGGMNGFKTFKEAIKDVGSKGYAFFNYKFMIFDSERELFEYFTNNPLKQK